MQVRLREISSAIIVTTALWAGAAAADDPDPCTLLGGVVVGASCEVSGSVVPAQSRIFLDRSLHVTSAGAIEVGFAGLDVQVEGDVVVDGPDGGGAGGRVSGDESEVGKTPGTIRLAATGELRLAGNGTGGARISSANAVTRCGAQPVGGSVGRVGRVLLEAGGDLIVEAGAAVLTNAVCSAGEIVLSAGDSLTVDGTLSAAGSVKNREPGGGPITLDAGCDLTVGATGIVQSLGGATGANLVSLGSRCAMAIHGLIESSGDGKIVPTAPANRCGGRFGKPSGATSCVEMISYTTLTIDGQVRANTASGRAGAAGWVDVLAGGDISVAGGAGEDWAIQSNGSGTEAAGGIVRVMTVGGEIGAVAAAIQANGAGEDARGGEVAIDVGAGTAGTDVDLGSARIEARALDSSGSPLGGTIRVRSYNGAVGGSATSSLDATAPGGNPGSIVLETCAPLAYGGTSQPAYANPGPSCGGGLLALAGERSSVVNGGRFDRFGTLLCGSTLDVSFRLEPTIFIDADHDEVPDPTEAFAESVLTREGSQCVGRFGLFGIEAAGSGTLDVFRCDALDAVQVPSMPGLQIMPIGVCGLGGTFDDFVLKASIRSDIAAGRDQLKLDAVVKLTSPFAPAIETLTISLTSPQGTFERSLQPQSLSGSRILKHTNLAARLNGGFYQVKLVPKPGVPNEYKLSARLFDDLPAQYDTFSRVSLSIGDEPGSALGHWCSTSSGWKTDPRCGGTPLP